MVFRFKSHFPPTLHHKQQIISRTTAVTLRHYTPLSHRRFKFQLQIINLTKAWKFMIPVFISVITVKPKIKPFGFTNLRRFLCWCKSCISDKIFWISNVPPAVFTEIL